MAMGAVLGTGTAVELDMMTAIKGPAAIQTRSRYFGCRKSKAGYRGLFLEIWEVAGRHLVGKSPRREGDEWPMQRQVWRMVQLGVETGSTAHEIAAGAAELHPQSAKYPRPERLVIRQARR